MLTPNIVRRVGRVRDSRFWRLACSIHGTETFDTSVINNSSEKKNHRGPLGTTEDHWKPIQVAPSSLGSGEGRSSVSPCTRPSSLPAPHLRFPLSHYGTNKQPFLPCGRIILVHRPQRRKCSWYSQPTAGLCPGPYGGPRGEAFSYERDRGREAGGPQAQAYRGTSLIRNRAHPRTPIGP